MKLARMRSTVCTTEPWPMLPGELERLSAGTYSGSAEVYHHALARVLLVLGVRDVVAGDVQRLLVRMQASLPISIPMKVEFISYPP